MERLTRAIAIRGDGIRLGQLLKLAGAVDTGGEIRSYLESERVLVNGEPEVRRGRQLRVGDTVTACTEELRVVAAE